MTARTLRGPADVGRTIDAAEVHGGSVLSGFLKLALLAALLALTLSFAWEIWVEPWLAERLGLVFGHWQHVLISTLVVLLALVASAGVLQRAEARRQAVEAAGKVCQRRFRQVIDASPMGMHLYRLDATGRLVLEDTNPAASTILGVDQQPLLGLAIEEAFPGLAGTEVPARYREICEQGAPWRCDELTYREGRITGVFEVHAFPIGPGEMVALFRDVSERRRAEEALQRSEERFRHLVESTRDWVWEVDPAGTYTYCSPQCRQLLGYGPEELLGRTPFDRMPTRDARRMRVLLSGLVAERLPISAVETVNLHRDGRQVVLETSAVPFFDPGGRLLGYRGMDRDVTERHRAESAVRALNADLEGRVRARTAELEYAYRELESFSYSVSHDLRAPLRGIDGFTLAVLEDYGDRLDDTGRAYLERVRAATRRMGLLIDDLLALSRVTRHDLRRGPTDLSALAEEIGQELNHRDGVWPVTLEVRPGLLAEADARLMRLALANLLENAWKFTSRVPDPRVEVGRAQDGTFYVRDNGVGFDMAYAHKLFTPFQRLHSQDEFPGTGIGLAIVQRVVHRHGGRTWAEATVGGGATFHFTLPALAHPGPADEDP